MRAGALDLLLTVPIPRTLPAAHPLPPAWRILFRLPLSYGWTFWVLPSLGFFTCSILVLVSANLLPMYIIH